MIRVNVLVIGGDVRTQVAVFKKIMIFLIINE